MSICSQRYTIYGSLRVSESHTLFMIKAFIKVSTFSHESHVEIIAYYFALRISRVIITL